MEPLQEVEVRCRFEGTWVGGFQVVGTEGTGTDRRYSIRRLSDGTILPSLFDDDELRARVPLPMTRRRSPAPAGAAGS